MMMRVLLHSRPLCSALRMLDLCLLVTLFGFHILFGASPWSSFTPSPIYLLQLSSSLFGTVTGSKRLSQGILFYKLG